MNYQIAFCVSLLFLVGAVVYIFYVRKQCDKYSLTYRPVKTERDNLREECRSLKQQLDAIKSEKAGTKAEHKQAKKSAREAAKTEKAVSEDAAKLQKDVERLKAELDEVRKRNYDLDRDNRDLRKGARDQSAANDDDARTILSLREELDQMRAAKTAAEGRVAELEKAAAASKDTESAEADALKSAREAAEKAETEAAAKGAENERLRASIGDLRTELAEFKKSYRDQIDQARREISDSVEPVREENAKLKKQLAQSKSRADNLHRVFVIARAQLMLAEQRLSTSDPSYRPIALGTSNAAIDEAVKKYNTMEARGSSADARELEQLRAEVTRLKAELDTRSAAPKPAPRPPQIITESLDDLLNSADFDFLPTDAKTPPASDI